ncbi:DUF4493 domain-containing protein [bacterium]|nr:DUF4493 domain-containing protein [bacterium]
MKIFREALLLSLAALALGSCSEDNPWANGRGKGGIDLKLSASADVQDALPMVRSGAPELNAPDVADFGIRLTNLDTDEARTWQSLADFNAEDGFDVGSYTLTAFYGNVNECGFDKPCFIGETTVNVLEGRESSAEVTAQLANVMMSVDYTDSFRNYFRDYSVTAHTDGHANVVYGKNETRAGFLTPGDVTLQVSLTNPSGKSVTLTPAQFPAQARHHYHVTFDVNADPTGNAVLKVEFDDNLTQEDVRFSLSDELYNADAPVVHAEGFTSGQTVEALSGNPSATPLKFETICKSGIQKAVLKIAQVSGTTQFNPSFDPELDLIQADEATQYQLEQNGIKVRGLFKNPDQMGVVDVTDLSRHLPEGTFELTLTVTDAVGRNNETPVVLNLSTLPINLVVTGGSAVYEYPGSVVTVNPTVDATVLVTYNGLNPAESISFKNLCRTGIYKDCDLVEVKESTATRGFPDKSYIFSIKVCDVETSPLPMELYFNGEKRAEFTLDIIEPQYSLVADPFATYARFKVETANAADIPTITNGLTLYKNGTAVDKSLVTTDPEKGMLTMDGLEPDTDYTIGYSLTTRPNGLPEEQTLKIHTEAAAQIPNSDFSQTSTTINMENVMSGGEYTGTVFGSPKYHYYSNIVRETPNGWCTLNEKTCWTGSTNKNTWFCVPSTYIENGVAVIKSVGYNHNGTTPSLDKTTARYYNPNAPTFSDGNKCAGELFLGTYSFNGTESRKDGIRFDSRPSSLSFDYSYSPLNSEKGRVEVKILDESGRTMVIASRDLPESTSTKTLTITLPEYTGFGVKAASIQLKFISSTASVPAISVPSGDALNEHPSNGLKNNQLPDNSYKAVAIGSVLKISNIELNY